MTRTTDLPLTLGISHAETEVTATVSYTFSPYQPATYMEPGYPAEAEVYRVEVNGVDIIKWLDRDTIAAIEEAICEEAPSEDEGDEADRAYDDWRDSEYAE